ncbi:TPA: Hha/YmoA family nucleoid-associated regulatory protein, partial [Escherichia coli]
SSRETLEKVISHTRYKLPPVELETFNSAVDHRLPEIITRWASASLTAASLRNQNSSQSRRWRRAVH